MRIFAAILSLAYTAHAADYWISVKKIWDQGAHNAFTDLIRFEDKWYCSFREGDGHVGGDGRLRILVSTDGDRWESAALLAEEGIDLRDPKLSVAADGRLMVVAGGSVYRGGSKLLGRQPRVAFSRDGRSWTPTQRVLSEGEWLWRVTWHEGKAWGAAYNAMADGEWKLTLVSAADGVNFRAVAPLVVTGRPNETTIRFLRDGTMMALVRREGGPTGSANAWIGTARPPYTEWSWKETGMRVGGPNFIQLPDGSLLAGTRRYDETRKMASTVLARMTASSLDPVAAFPSFGDNSYPGLVMHQGTLWMSYYSSHEGKTSIYLAKVKLPGVGSEVVWNLDPTKENPRNSEGSFVTLNSGRVLFVYTQFYGGSADESPARLVSIHSDDGGRTWSSQPQTVVDNTAGANVMSVSLLRLKSGKLALFYIVKNSWTDCGPYVRFSTDEARTWSAPTRVVAAPGYFVLNNDRVVQLSSGRLVVPVAFHRARGTEDSIKSFDARAVAMWYHSDDEGTTWKESSSWWALPAKTGSGLQEPGLVELEGGTLNSWTRTDQGSQFGMVSTDQGQSWSAPVATEMKSPVSPASIKRLPGSPDLLAIYNDHSGRFPFPARKRTPLIAAISRDGGKTWPHAKLLESDPDGWYCYTAIHYVGDSVLLAYCAGDSKVGGLNRLRIRRVSLDWLGQ